MVFRNFRPYWFVCVLLLASTSLFAGRPGYVPNGGQWDDAVLFRAEFGGGAFFIDRQGITLLTLEDHFLDNLHHWVRDKSGKDSGKISAVKLEFLGGNFSAEPIVRGQSGSPINYYLGDDPSRWATGLYAHREVTVPEVYPGIGVAFGSIEGHFKYNFELNPGADPGLIRVKLHGQNTAEINDGRLVIKTDVRTITELPPEAFQLTPLGDTIRVACNFVLKGDILTYTFPEGYDAGLPLIIDPVIAFSTYVGSTNSSFGFTACNDHLGNAYGGAVSFGFDYPTTSGTFQLNYGYGVVDCGITKFSADGTTLLYSSFLGGSSGESPHSLVVNTNNELYILGSTGSSNFPVSGDAFQPAHAGGTNYPAVGYSYQNGSDLFITKVSADGGALLGSTYIGGSANDGVGTSPFFLHNYGDAYRGEIVTDDAGNAYVATITNSGDFPIIGGYSSDFGGTQSGIVFKMSPGLDAMLWSTYVGGNDLESAFSLQLAPDNSVYFTGSTLSSNLPTASNAYQPQKSNGVDGFIGHISADGSTLLACTYNGTPGWDQNYFIQLDLDGNVYVVGQTDGDYPIFGNVYSNPNSNQFIQKFSADLSSSPWSTQIGSGDGISNFSPSAFLVSFCGQIYISGWGGSLSGNGTTDDLPVTPDAFQSNTDGADFYLMVLAPDAGNLVYGTFFGGNQSSEHVDGGTSRFDKNGTVYQAVCAGCFGNNDFPTQPGVWSPTNGSTLCNMAVFKFKLSQVSAIAAIDAPAILCPGSEFSLVNNSLDADTYLWNFGDGSTSNLTEPTHSFAEAGTYTIKLLASNYSGCVLADSIEIEVEVAPYPDIEVEDAPPICPGETLQLEASGASDWLWIPASGLNADNISNPVFSGDASTSYQVIGTTACGTDTVEIDVTVGNLNTSVSENQTICPGDSVELSATGGIAYDWTPSEGLSDPSSAHPVASPEFTTAYQVTITTGEGCDAVETVTIVVLPPPPSLSGPHRYVSCDHSVINLHVNGADEYAWSPSTGLSAIDIPNPQANPDEATTYTVTGTNACGTDTMQVQVLTGGVDVGILTDSIVCYNAPFYVEGTGAQSYVWQPAERFTDNKAQKTQAIIEGGIKIMVTGFDSLGCFDTESRWIQIYPRPNFRAGNDFVISYGGSVQLAPESDFPVTWEYSPWLSCQNCNFPIATPHESTTFYAGVTSPYGCVEKDSVRVNVRGLIYVPNAFTPDGDGLNDIFKARGTDISSFEMEIYNRWGELVFRSDDIDRGWNGSLRGNAYYCPPDVYQYRIVATEHEGKVFELKGHVTLLR